MTSIHPYVMRGPYKDKNKKWYCEYKFCEKTKHLKSDIQTISYWLSSKYENDFILCDDCVKKYARSLVNNKKKSNNKNRLFSIESPKKQKIKEGYMTKQGGAIKTWRRRYFVLCADGQMNYYKQKENQEFPQGTVDISTTYRTIKLASHHEFHVSTRERTWWFRAENEVEKKMIGCILFLWLPMMIKTIRPDILLTILLERKRKEREKCLRSPLL